MKTIPIKIIVAFIIILVALMSLSKVYDFALKNNLNIKASFIQKQKINAELLIHGPCEALWIIHPDIIKKHTHLKTYNLGLSHSDFADNYLHLYLYLKNNKAPKYLFLYVTSESMDLNYNTFNTYRFAPFIGDVIVDSTINECDNAYFKWTKIPFMKYAYYQNNINFNMLQGLKHYFTHKTQPYFSNGYEPPFHVVWDNHLEEFIQLYPHGYNFVWSNLREKYLRKIIELAQKHNIQVCLYESPVLQEALPYLPNRPLIINKIKSIAQQYDIKYVQFENMEMAKSRKYYSSTLVMNLQGSTIFSDTLGAYIESHIINK